ncbi:hypothetical protein BU24DRAFT_413498 [Aaosphaeria arxii CBS 175.79]|uniref:Uncharacterized protein n=1 Tax=Aaosphaeria arxii CBS 175.79 TaxID=1450172 RepID=A0A6A5XD24_9PLEO|nr:uncharacterized protein BU24DRAFT_413498 [Aaosphaeria arxii CBS 175.79]KAF2010773.1 hypothetical protein BU24DRAFT_413498 [Aaosphaeria arxii CBS 175.79]
MQNPTTQDENKTYRSALTLLQIEPNEANVQTLKNQRAISNYTKTDYHRWALLVLDCLLFDALRDAIEIAIEVKPLISDQHELIRKCIKGRIEAVETKHQQGLIDNPMSRHTPLQGLFSKFFEIAANICLLWLGLKSGFLTEREWHNFTDLWNLRLLEAYHQFSTSALNVIQTLTEPHVAEQTVTQSRNQTKGLLFRATRQLSVTIQVFAEAE